MLDCVLIIPVDIYLLKVNNGNTRTRCEMCSILTINFNANGVVLVSLLLTWNIFHATWRQRFKLESIRFKTFKSKYFEYN